MTTAARYALALACAGAMASSALAANVTPTKANGDFISGTGIPSDNFTVTTVPNGESVALKGRLRDTGQPLSQSGNVYYVPVGLAADNVNPAWSFDFQFSPGANGLHPADYVLTLDVDFDPAVGATDFTTISMPVIGPDGLFTPLLPDGWDDTDGFFTNPGGGAWSDDNVPYVISNSYHLDFLFWSLLGAPPYDPDAPGEYQINLAIGDSGGSLIASSSILVNVVPEPATLGLALMGGFFGAAVFLRRRWG